MKKTTKKYCICHYQVLGYQTYGQGSEIILAFHGYGQDHRVFQAMGELLGHRYTVYSIDLFFHGNSSWLSRHKALPKKEWSAIIEHFLQSQCITNFSLLGYSMGGRFALTLVEYFAERIDQIILVAPDGIRLSYWHRFTSATLLGNYLLRASVNHPRFLFTLIPIAHRFHLVDKGVLKFVKGHMDTRRKRYAVYCRWIVFRRIQPDLQMVAQRCNQQSIEVTIYLGRFDRIVKERNVMPLHKKLNSSTLYHLPSGHNSLVREAIQHLSKKV